MDGMKAELADMRKIVQLEEGCADPATLDALKQAYREKVGARAGWAAMAGSTPPCKGERSALLGGWHQGRGAGHVQQRPILPNQRPCPRPAAGGMLFAAGKPLRQAPSDVVLSLIMKSSFFVCACYAAV